MRLIGETAAMGKLSSILFYDGFCPGFAVLCSYSSIQVCENKVMTL